MAYPSWLPILLGFLTAVGPISTDMYLPAFPALEAALGEQQGAAQITLATWFVGLAFGQLTQGSLADRFGRRRPLLLATWLYTAASAACALAPDLATLSAARFVAGFSGSASMVIPRATVRDLADGHAAARLMARLILVMGAAPILAPTLGGLVLTIGSWRTIFWFGTAYGAICAVLVAAFLPETLPPRFRLRVGLAGTLQRFLLVGRDRVFLCYAVVAGGGMFGMFAFIGGSSPVLIEHFGVSPPAYGLLFGCVAFAYIGFSQLSPVLLPRFGADRLLRVATIVYLVDAAIMLACAILQVGGVPAIVAPVVVLMACMGLIMPNAMVSALSRHAAQAGTASAVLGTLTFTFAAIAGALVGALGDGTSRALAALVATAALIAFAAERLGSRLRRLQPARLSS